MIFILTMVDEKYLEQLGIGVASLTFGVALSIFIYAAVSGAVTGMHAWLLYIASFLLMLRFWWRYTELFVRFLPSKCYWHFLLDFAISFFGIIAVLFVSNIQIWAAVGAAAMVASMIRCSLSRKDAEDTDIKKALGKTLMGSLVMFVIFGIIYFVAPFADIVALSAAVLVLVIIFVAYASRKV
jgi:hypothetical protein